MATTYKDTHEAYLDSEKQNTYQRSETVNGREANVQNQKWWILK